MDDMLALIPIVRLDICRKSFTTYRRIERNGLTLRGSILFRLAIVAGCSHLRQHTPCSAICCNVKGNDLLRSVLSCYHDNGLCIARW